MKAKITQSMYLVVFLLLGTSIGAWAQWQPAIQNFRPYDQGGLNMYEAPKQYDTVVYDGFKIRFGANFTQGYQKLANSNSAKAILTSTAPNSTPSLWETAPASGIFTNNAGVVQAGTFVPDPNIYGGYLNTSLTTGNLFTNGNQVYEQAGGFPLAMANFNIDVQLTDGVRLNLVSYMSSHHHNEFWVKGGYFQIDKVKFLGSEFMNNLWKNLTLKVGHMEINYGDAHFRRSDGGNAMWNAFIDNQIIDQFTTEIGGELYWQKNGVITMLGVTDGEIQGNVSKPNDRSPSIYGKLGYDKKFGDRKRARITGSFYNTASSISNTLYGGDRTGSNYQYVVQPWNSTLTGNAFAGRYNPGFSDNVSSFMINPSAKFNGFEFFGTYEEMQGNSSVENGEVKYSNLGTPYYYNNTPGQTTIASRSNRKFVQYEADLVYRFGKNENYYVGAKYNYVKGDHLYGQSTSQSAPSTTNIISPGGINQGYTQKIAIERTSIAAGWYITRNVMFKGEYVVQRYYDFPTDDIRSKGWFEGFVIQGVIGF
jgi:hypothetical protein